MGNKKERKMLNVTANLVGEVKVSSFEWDGESIDVANFALIKKVDGKRQYTNCSAYNKWSEEAKKLQAGDLVHVYGFIKKRQSNGKTYRNFIVKHMNKIIEEKMEEK